MSENTNTGWGGTAQKSSNSTLYGKGATVQGLGEGQFRITYLPLENRNGEKTPVYFPGTQESSKIFKVDQLPLRLADKFNRTLVVISSMTDEGLKVTHFQPWEGAFEAKFIGYRKPNGKDTPAAPYEGKRKTGQDSKKGTKFDYQTLQFSPYWEITRNKFFKGQVLVQFLEFSKTDFMKKDANGNPKVSPMFVSGANGLVQFGFELTANNTALAWPSQRRQEVFDHLKYTGIMDEPAFVMPEDGNPLPMFEKLALKQNREVVLTIVKGQIASVIPFDDFDDEGIPAGVDVQSEPTQVEQPVADMDEE